MAQNVRKRDLSGSPDFAAISGGPFPWKTGLHADFMLRYWISTEHGSFSSLFFTQTGWGGPIESIHLRVDIPRGNHLTGTL